MDNLTNNEIKLLKQAYDKEWQTVTDQSNDNDIFELAKNNYVIFRLDVREDGSKYIPKYRLTNNGKAIVEKIQRENQQKVLSHKQAIKIAILSAIAGAIAGTLFSSFGRFILKIIFH